MKKTYFFYVVIMLFISGLLNLYSQKNAQQDSISKLIELSRSKLYEDKVAAIKYLDIAESLYLEKFDKKIYADIIYARATVFYVSADYHLALENFLEGLEIYQEIKDQVGISKSLTGIGLVEMGLENYEVAIYYFNKAIVNKSEKQEYMNAANFFNKGIAFMDLNVLDSSEHYLRKSLKLAIKNKRVETEHMAINRFGQLNLQKGEIDSAFYYFQKLLNHPVEINTWERTFAYRGLALYYLEKNKYDIANKYANDAIVLAKKIPSKWEIYMSYEVLSKIAHNQNNAVLAYEYLKLHNVYKDSVVGENVARKVKYLQFLKKESEYNKLNLEKTAIQKQLRDNKIIVVLLVLFVGFFVVVIYFLSIQAQIKSKFNRELGEKNDSITLQNENLEKLNTTKTKLLSILSHDMKSPLASIEQVLSMYQQEVLSKLEKEELLQKLQIQVGYTLEMLNNMVIWAQSQLEGLKTERILLNPHLTLTNVIQNAHLSLELKNITVDYINYLEQEVWCDPNHLKIIFQNVLSNSIKFSYPNSKITIHMEDFASEVKIYFTDNGIGLSKELMAELNDKKESVIANAGTSNEMGTGIGLLLIKNLLKLNQGRLEIKNKHNKGAVFIIVLKK
ncbi:tetratricopeptide repeat-containing sensor histidine kinase [Flavobacterium sp. UBA6135]|uniref:tetratricopeptide repeat-containing sensor histidine kinase n=1 Tax=Flavobacterium sp. UBA6135 TaxID=1946553 RepID=UPI0025BB267F|nr:tetratricopeptide repeat-containing sensor histidine kinase [Flavobacterium sp. UBA6135]